MREHRANLMVTTVGSYLQINSVAHVSISAAEISLLITHKNPHFQCNRERFSVLSIQLYLSFLVSPRSLNVMKESPRLYFFPIYCLKKKKNIDCG